MLVEEVTLVVVTAVMYIVVMIKVVVMMVVVAVLLCSWVSTWKSRGLNSEVANFSCISAGALLPLFVTTQ